MNKISQKQSEKNHQGVKPAGTRAEEIKSLVKRGLQSDKISEMRNAFMQDIFSDDGLIKEYGALVSATKKLTPKQVERREELSSDITMSYGLKNGLWAKNLSYGKYHKALGRMRHDIATEYSCKTSLELMLADRIVASYWRAMNCDMAFNRLAEEEDGGLSFDQLRVNVLKEFSRGIELASRQLNADIILLKELKQPVLKVNVKTNTAFVSQNQQFNINPDQDENIEPK
ncbi:MAG: hypothetical protein NTW46_03870 [Candidatus Nealsonbacteria bacterium]|nr:hypothetical protein [Candidatus Nealsonbacteria bacterium]